MTDSREQFRSVGLTVYEMELLVRRIEGDQIDRAEWEALHRLVTRLRLAIPTARV